MKTAGRLAGKVAIVTGSSRGIGKAVALGLAQEGASVVVCARSEFENEKLPGTIFKTADEIRALGQRALPVKCDISNEHDIEEMVKKALQEFGRIDILVNNVGIAVPQSILEMSLKRWELVLRINLTGAFLCSKAVLPGMIERKTGSIINISSIAATDRFTGFTGIAYGVSKAGLERFTWSLASEVGRYNIAVNALKPKEGVDTEGLRLVSSETSKKFDKPDRMVKVAIFLAAQTASQITGMVATDEEYCLWHGLS